MHGFRGGDTHARAVALANGHGKANGDRHGLPHTGTVAQPIADRHPDPQPDSEPDASANRNSGAQSHA